MALSEETLYVINLLDDVIILRLRTYANEHFRSDSSNNTTLFYMFMFNMVKELFFKTYILGKSF